MRTLARLLFCVLLCSITPVLFAQTDKPATASITGRITFKNQPLPGVTVTLESGGVRGIAPASARRPVTAKTDQDGRYRLLGIAAGEYLVSPRALAYVLPAEGWTGRPGKNVNIGDGEQIENIDFTLVKGGVIAGRITDHLERPVIQQRVNLRRFIAPESTTTVPFSVSGFFMSETDDRGMYRLFGLQAGRYLLSVGEGGEQGVVMIGRTGKFYPRTFYPDAKTEKEAKVIEVTEGGEVTGIDIKLPKPEKSYEARGRVIDASTGTPLIGLGLTYRQMGNDPTLIGAFGMTQERTNAQGEFLLQGLLPGKYMAVMQAMETASEYYSDPITFEIFESDVEGLEVRATRGASISGLVVIEGTTDPAMLKRVTDVLVSVYPETPPSSPSAQMPMLNFGGNRQTNPDGTFRLAGVRPGKNRLSANVMGMMTPLMVARIERDGVEIPGALDITAGDQITGIKVVMVFGSGIIRGQVTVVNGTLPPDAQLLVSAQRLSGASRTGGRPAQVDARGKFVLEGLAPGEYELVLSSFMRAGAAPGSRPPVVRQKITVGAGETTATLTYDLGAKKEEKQ
jgi:hypothetical protein